MLKKQLSLNRKQTRHARVLLRVFDLNSAEQLNLIVISKKVTKNTLPKKKVVIETCCRLQNDSFYLLFYQQIGFTFNFMSFKIAK